MQKLFNYPNLLTLFRILLTPLFLYFLFNRYRFFEILALLIFVVASVTDVYDGYIARKYSSVTKMGKFLDPLADKILMSAAFISFVVLDLIPLWMVILVILRDFIVTGIRILMNSQNQTMVTRKSAKVKTGIQVGVICFILVYLITQRWKIFLGISDYLKIMEDYKIIYGLMLITTIITVWTGIEYIVINLNSIRQAIRRWMLRD
ncbi:MAG: CDP-diacylglycerol--glycerol-3-phosphate 3-phosphatidyltransferase [Candidatus Marinimicrobia bacterium]|jgi:CDP-diacylglycerol--glycerol-3-phosphate 3-phosphatidyltransferase|nr:CDP-diacylglycerol--glycerol-3-phosphate 3-phosphatidyltransferase [Candidatus Neomarinimicrobiota bacterium]MCK9482983.1 CDP-diacylglycerol--glycerol-3-phosphate 3-phosphatidyltransferase [Candidatus Neomarinimicrobiota bacterium]MCK9558894.1 CDP-diacylglycerol--glycerol-3-phosphate 3-phosphatidyltransferase [Candidatus Neomarinimicrobiota bacterium]MDD5061729.1 CDP-diacylglycerol--glycerol-3-phosphate 3-phosphatidyltransferase [Candidatus Neomarinimicrobiota bacterium]